MAATQSPIEAARSRCKGGQTPWHYVAFSHEARLLWPRGLTPAHAALAGRAGTISTASPSSTGLPSTEQTLSKRARRLAG